MPSNKRDPRNVHPVVLPPERVLRAQRIVAEAKAAAQACLASKGRVGQSLTGLTGAGRDGHETAVDDGERDWPTYESTPCQRFPVTRVEKQLNELLQGVMDEVKVYDKSKIGALTTRLSKAGREIGLQCGCSGRYRYVCTAIVGQVLGQGEMAATRFLWDPDNDSYAEVTYRNTSNIYATLALFAVYRD